MSRKKLFITGGHVTPAMAVMEEITKRKLPWDIVFVGRRYALVGSTHDSAEYTLARERGWRFLSITTGRLHRDNIVKVCMGLWKIPLGIWQAYMYCRQERPDAVLSFGGYIAAPIALAAYLTGVPIITHEQTRRPGIANRMIGMIARRICLTFPDENHVFPKEKIVLTGLPIRSALFDPPAKAPIAVDTKKPLLYITGGSTGAVSLNNLVFPIVKQLTKNYTVVHQTGDESLHRAKELRTRLPSVLQKRYSVHRYIDASMVSWVLHRASLVIGRSGANTVVELAVLGKVAIFIPLPWSGEGEQEANAQWLSKHGGAVVLGQSTATPESLRAAINTLFASLDAHHARAEHFSKMLPRNGASRVVDELATIL